MSETHSKSENVYARGPLIKRAVGPIFPIHDQAEVDLECKDSEFIHVWVDGVNF